MIGHLDHDIVQALVDHPQAESMVYAVNRLNEACERQARAVTSVTWGVAGAAILGMVVAAAQVWGTWMAG